MEPIIVVVVAAVAMDRTHAKWLLFALMGATTPLAVVPTFQFFIGFTSFAGSVSANLPLLRV